MTEETQALMEELVSELRSLRTEVARQRDTIAQIQEGSREQVNVLHTEIDRLRTLSTTPQPTATPTLSAAPEPSSIRIEANPAPTFTPPPRPRYPDVEPFDGEDVRDYRAFRINLHTKFLVDSHCYFSDEERILYAFSRLRKKAN